MDIIDKISQGIEQIIGADALKEKLADGKRLKVKLGVDPTRPDLTFGHLVVFKKLREFQDLGHEAILIIGDFTTLIGDPSGRSSTRPVLTKEEIKDNATTYLDQAFKILDKEKTTVRYNSEWFNEMNFLDCLHLTRKMTVARMLERDDFSKRHKENTPISIIEFLYPLIQGYDSLILDSDVEIGGNDQLFNMLVGRALQKDAGKSEQTVITLPLLVGLDGVRKMSKSYDNYISFNDSAKDMFGKIMSVSDEGMWQYYKFLLSKTDEEVDVIKQDHPMASKKALALTLTASFHSVEEAKHELAQFEQVFSKNKIPDDMPELAWAEISNNETSIPLVDIILQGSALSSKGEIRRLIKQGAVKMNGQKISDATTVLEKPTDDVIIQAGKRVFVKVTN